MKLEKEDVSCIIENTIADCIPDADKEISRTIAMAVATQLCEDTDEIHLQTRRLLVNDEDMTKMETLMDIISLQDYYNMRNAILSELTIRS